MGREGGGLLRGICAAVDWVRDRGEFVWPGDPIPPTPGISRVERAEGEREEGCGIFITLRDICLVKPGNLI